MCRSAEWGFEFAYPDSLAVGRYKDTTTPEMEAKMREVGQESPWKHAVAFYYLLPVREDLVVELFAHKKHLDSARTDTGYDRVIEGIIASFKTIPPGG